MQVKQNTWLIRGLLVLLFLLMSACTSWRAAPGPDVGTAEQPAVSTLEHFYDYRLFYTDGGRVDPRQVTLADAGRILAGFDVIFLGEMHRHPGSHLLQMQLLQSLHRYQPTLSLSMEQFETDVQQLVDQFMRGELGEWALRTKARAWENYRSSYRPLVEFARNHGLPVIAAEAPTDIIVCIGREGLGYLDRLPEDRRLTVATDVDLDLDGDYVKKYLEFANSSSTHGKAAHGGSQHGGGRGGISPAMLNSLSAQVARDETMAQSIHLHLQQNPGRRVVHLNGAFHSDGFMGTVDKLKKRNAGLKIAVLSPVQVENVEQLRVTAEQAAQGTFVALLYPAGPEVVQDENRGEWIRSIIASRKKHDCAL
jgi:uncharacterized iron-regulated protein